MAGYKNITQKELDEKLEVHQEYLRTGNEKFKAKLSGYDLHELNFNFDDLREINFNKTRLSYYDDYFRRNYFIDFKGKKINGCTFIGASIHEGQFDKEQWLNLITTEEKLLLHKEKKLREEKEKREEAESKREEAEEKNNEATESSFEKMKRHLESVKEQYIIEEITWLLIIVSIFGVAIWFECNVKELNDYYIKVPLVITGITFLYFSVYQFNKAKNLRLENENKLAVIVGFIGLLYQYGTKDDNIKPFLKNTADVLFTKLNEPKGNKGLPISEIEEVAKVINSIQK